MAHTELEVVFKKESREFLGNLEALVVRLEKAVGKKTAPVVEEEEDDIPELDADVTNQEDEEDELPAPKAAASFDDEEEELVEEEKPAKKAAKPAKLTSDDVNAACLERAGRTNRAEVLGILKKKFKVKSISQLKPEQYADVVKVMKGK